MNRFYSEYDEDQEDNVDMHVGEIFADEMRKVSRATKNGASEELSRASERLGPYVAGRYLDRSKVVLGLTKAAAKRGVKKEAAKDLVKTGLQAASSPTILVHWDAPMALAAAVVHCHRGPAKVPMLVHHAERWWCFESDGWIALSESDLNVLLWRMLDQTKIVRTSGQVVEEEEGSQFVEHPFKVTGHRVADVARALLAQPGVHVASAPSRWTKEGTWEPIPRGSVIALRNGLLDVDTLETEAPSPAVFVPHPLQVALDMKARAPLFREKLAEWVPDPGGRAALQEFAGLLLVRDTSHQKLLVVVGPTRSGKGTMASLLQAVLGEHNWAATSLPKLDHNFGLAEAYKKRALALFVGDSRADSKSIGPRAIETVLGITGRDAVPIELKGHDILTARLDARLVLAMNTMPKLRDAAGALKARMVVVSFPNSFAGREDPTLLDRLNQELAGIFRWALEGLRRLRKTGRFSTAGDVAEILAEFEGQNSNVFAFARAKLKLEAKLRVSPRAVYKAYRAWATRSAIPSTEILAENAFGAELRQVVPRLGQGTRLERKRLRGRDGSRSWIYRGIGLRT